MVSQKKHISTGIKQLDQLLGGLYVGDNVIWYDDAGSLASIFCTNLIQASYDQKRPLIYVSFDRSPKNLLEKLGPLAQSQHLTILDCFTHGKGDGSEIFNKFYEKNGARWPYQIIKVNDPAQPDQVMEAIYHLHKTMQDNVRLVFESLTGMQDLWGGEEHARKFYSHSCPRLYELDTIAYWIVEKEAHSSQLKAHINQIAQVAIDLTLKRGKSALTIIKAEKRNLNTLGKPYIFNTSGAEVNFDATRRTPAEVDLGHRIKEFRKTRGFSQKELARLVGVTPSSISQIESNQIYPSLPALIKIAENLAVEMGAFFGQNAQSQNRIVFEAQKSLSGQSSRKAFLVFAKGASNKQIIFPEYSTANMS
jgi:transcriptional regulator with XRE-family HTH domain/KaiC/GvpD/RAD55 family RecA-like ATPase